MVLAASILAWLACLAVAGIRLRGLLFNSSLLGAATSVIAIPVGTMLAVSACKTQLLGRRWLERGMIIMLFVPLYVQATAWQATVGQGGWLVNQSWLSGWYGAIWIHGMAAIPWVFLFVSAALRKVPREYEEEALQDTSTLQVVLRVSLRHAITGIAAATLWIFVICFSEIAVTDLFQIRTFAEEIYTAASLGTLNTAADISEVPQLALLDLWIGTLSVLFLFLATLAAIWMWVPLVDFVAQTTDWSWRSRAGRSPLGLATWTLAAVIAGTPMLGLLGKAGAVVEQVDGQVVRQWSAAKAAQMVVESPWQHRREFGWSLAIGATATLIAISLSIVVAWAIRSQHLFFWPVTLALAFGFAVPGPLLGVWIIDWMNHSPDSVLWPLTWCYDHTILAPTIAQLIRSLPITLLVIGSQFASLPQDLLDSATSDGASWVQQLHKVAIPSAWPAIIIAASMAMIVSVGDLAATLLVVPPGVSPLSVRIFGLLHYGAEDQVCALCFTLILAIGLTLAATTQLTQLLAYRTNNE